MKQQHPDNHVLMAVLYAQAGLLPEAQMEVAELTSRNATSPVLFGWAASLTNAAAPQRKTQ
jgi:hypothetical protein